jgi:hypothetical protein
MTVFSWPVAAAQRDESRYVKHAHTTIFTLWCKPIVLENWCRLGDSNT